jgi:hypothetical protein
LCVTIDTFAPTMWFVSVDFPAFGSPIKATNPARVVIIASPLEARVVAKFRAAHHPANGTTFFG